MHASTALLTLVLATTATLAGAAPTAARFSARDIGNLGFNGVSVTGLNALGQVVGQSERPGAGIDFPHAYATGPDGVGMVDLCPSLPEAACGASAISDAGALVGWVESGFSFSSRADGTGFFYIDAPVDVVGINATGRVVGNSPSTGVVAASVTSRFREIGSLTGPGGFSSGVAINARGAVVGCSPNADGASHAYVEKSRAAGLTDLGTLGGATSCATSIDDVGDVAGYAAIADGSGHAFYAAKGRAPLRDIGTLGGQSSVATGVNSKGHVVGYSTVSTSPFRYHAFLFDAASGRTIDLNSLVELPAGVTLDQAMAINERDQIAATSSDGHAWLLTPIAGF